MPKTDVYYIQLPTGSTDQADSLATYLSSHGQAAVAETDVVTCVMEDPAGDPLVHALHQAWKLYWEHSDAELFGLPAFRKEGCGEGCPPVG